MVQDVLHYEYQGRHGSEARIDATLSWWELVMVDMADLKVRPQSFSLEERKLGEDLRRYSSFGVVKELQRAPNKASWDGIW